MAFNDKYIVTDNYKPNILSFFGFEIVEEEGSYTQGVYISDPDSPTGKSKVYGTHSCVDKYLVRKKKPTKQELDLENQFISLVENKSEFRRSSAFGGTFFEPFSTPYVQKRVSDIYEREYVKNAPKTKNNHIFTIIGIAICVLWFALYNFIFPFFEQAMGYDAACVAYVFPFPILIIAATILINKIIGNKNDAAFFKYMDEQPYFLDLPESQQDLIRQKYYDQFVTAYGKEAADVLLKYAKLNGYYY